ncbi:hypothetical protein EZV61_11420 [Corallincola luteus]|uniref:Glycine zipper 2TM domain-containing protein n=1 Tax=Corallincola luteus TaxID=1775177 RepID=A0ABY2AJF0_9GAMM|nr:hypothetical protein [Corallincola luteus]TCI02897.1 hypothetical protein EZV61_11420 [Corallincola luteus]
MHRFIVPFIFLGWALLMAPCARSTTATDDATHQLSYGHVTAVEITTAQSAFARNAVMGGLAGAVIGGKWHVASGALSGVSAVLIVTSIAEGDSRVFLYTVSQIDGSQTQIALEHGGIGIGQCVGVEQQDKYANLRLVSPVYFQMTKSCTRICWIFVNNWLSGASKQSKWY